ncbi:hypothetical protein [Paracoccus sp. ME4]|uniref:hypothetical protein n=1 Tax=Paracoccus sp. ME4 TaxID=3138066 RepID=UPI00398ABDB0
MLPFIPLMIAMTLAVSYALAPYSATVNDSPGVSLSHNLLLEHSRLVRLAIDQDLVSGRIGGDTPEPLVLTADWVTQVVNGDGMVVVATYMPAGADLNTQVLRAFGEISNIRLRNIPRSYVGNYVYASGGIGGTIGTGDFSDMQLPIPENHPAIVTVIDPNYSREP